jgi:hypothetical protein
MLLRTLGRPQSLQNSGHDIRYMIGSLVVASFERVRCPQSVTKRTRMRIESISVFGKPRTSTSERWSRLYHRRARLVCAEMRLSDRLPLPTRSASCETGWSPTIQIKLIVPKRIRLRTIAAERIPRTTDRLRRKDALNRSGCDI